MTNRSRYAQTYQNTALDTTDNKHLLVMLYDTALRHLYQARESMAAGELEDQCDSIVKAQRIISALMSSLDSDPAPELAENLWNLYNWLYGQLAEAGIRDDAETLETVIEVMGQLGEAWRKAAASCCQQTA